MRFILPREPKLEQWSHFIIFCHFEISWKNRFFLGNLRILVTIAIFCNKSAENRFRPTARHIPSLYNRFHCTTWFYETENCFFFLLNGIYTVSPHTCFRRHYAIMGCQNKLYFHIYSKNLLRSPGMLGKYDVRANNYLEPVICVT
jgi:hypothetical protein